MRQQGDVVPPANSHPAHERQPGAFYPNSDSSMIAPKPGAVGT